MRFMRGTVTSLDNGSVSGDTKYMHTDELEPLVNPELEWKLCLSDIKSDNWSRQFEACIVLRRVCKYHQKELILNKGNKIDKTSTDNFHTIIE